MSVLSKAFGALCILGCILHLYCALTLFTLYGTPILCFLFPLYPCLLFLSHIRLVPAPLLSSFLLSLTLLPFFPSFPDPAPLLSFFPCPCSPSFLFSLSLLQFFPFFLVPFTCFFNSFAHFPLSSNTVLTTIVQQKQLIHY
jgi:hypothetical protein